MQKWNERTITSEHYQRFRNITVIHQLTLNWIEELSNIQDTFSFSPKSLRLEIQENLWMLSYLNSLLSNQSTQQNQPHLVNLETILESLLDDTDVSDTIIRLENTVWAFQCSLLNLLFNQTSGNQKINLEGNIEQITWRAGRKLAENLWPKLSQSKTEDLRKVLLAFHHTPFMGYPKSLGSLVKRSTKKEVKLELCYCPHFLPIPEVKPLSDYLCSLYSHWARGFGYALNQQISLEHSIASPRCIQRWFIS
jgi:hypothetical protein